MDVKKLKLKKGPILYLTIVLGLLILFLLILLIGNSLISFKLDTDVLEAPYKGENYEYPKVTCSFLGLKANAKLTKELDLGEMGEQEIEYTCSKAIFKKSKKYTVKVMDKIPPEITLNGNTETSVYIGKKYIELGAKANDNMDGDVTDSIVISGEINNQVIGSYEIKYSATDKSGNVGTGIRKVHVKEMPSALSCGEKGVIYLTFDDGPNNTNTPLILDVLKKYDVKATFFVTNSGSDALIKREYDEGHAIGLHSASHAYEKIYVSTDAFFRDLDIVAARVKRITGVDATLTRFPGGSSNTVSRKYNKGIMTTLTKQVEDKGYNYVDWNKDSGDAGQLKSSTFDAKVKEEINNVTSTISKNQGNVILMHDIKQTTANAIEEIVKYGIDNGYTFKVLDHSVICHQKINN